MISLLIPTYNRSKIAVGTVLAWTAQLASYKAEIIVVDDGSQSEHAAYLQEHLSGLAHVNLIQQRNAGLAAARNVAIDASSGEYLYFVDDDIRPGDETTLDKALERVRATQEPIVGRTRVPAAYRRTVVQHLWHHRFVNGTANFTDGQTLGLTGFWFAAMIMPRSALHGERFATNFTGYAWEEHELGYRLHQLGVRVQFRSDLWHEHLDMVNFSELLKKYEAMGAQAVTFSDLHPGLRVAFLTGTAWLSRFVKTVLAYGPRSDRAVKKLAKYADEPFVGDPEALAVLSRDLFMALEGAYFRGTIAELQERKRR